jgi:hypothetical protein
MPIPTTLCKSRCPTRQPVHDSRAFPPGRILCQWRYSAGWLVGFYWKSIAKALPHKPFEKPADTPDQCLAAVVEIVSTVEPFASQAARPRGFLSKPEFVRGVEILTDRSVSFSTLLSHNVGACNQLVATIENDIWRTQKSDLLLLSSRDEIWDSPQGIK